MKAEKTSSTSNNMSDEEMTEADVSKADDAANPPAEDKLTAAAADNVAKHTITEVPKFRFVAIAKKSEGYSSAAAGSYIEGKSAKELAARYEYSGAVAPDIQKKKDTVVVGKLDVAENLDEVEDQFEYVHISEEESEDEENVEEEPAIKAVGQSEEEDLERQKTVTATRNSTASVPVHSGEEKEEEKSEEEDLEAAIPVTEEKRVNDEVLIGVMQDVRPETNKDARKDATDVIRCKCNTKKCIIFLLIGILAAAAVVLGVALGTRPRSEDTSGLRGENQDVNNGVGANNTGVGANNISSTEFPSASEALASWNAPTKSPTSLNPTQDVDNGVGANNTGVGANNTGVGANNISSTEFPSASEALASWNAPTKSPTSLNPTQDNEVRRCISSPIQSEDYCTGGAQITQQVLEPRGGSSNLADEFFGNSLVFINDTFLAAGTNGSGFGVQLYYKPENSVTWDHYATLFEEDQRYFGYGIAASKDTNTLLIGSPSASETGGIVYVVEPTEQNWEIVTTIYSGDATDFGSEVAMNEDVIAIGSPDSDKVFIYGKDERFGWIPKETISSTEKGTGFGSSISLSGGILVVGAPLEGVGGAAYVYAKSDSGFVMQGPPLTVRDISPGDNFGAKVSISGCTIAVSIPNDTTTASNGTGSVRIFNYDALYDFWSADQIIESTEEVAGVFGECIAMEGDNLLVGSSRGGTYGTLTHFVKRNNVWKQQSVIVNPAPADDGLQFGCGLAVSGTTALVGAKGSEQGTPGRFYVVDLCPDDESI